MDQIDTINQEETLDPKFFEKYIIKLIFSDVDVRDKIYPFLHSKYFDMNFGTGAIVESYTNFKEKYKNFPTPSEFGIYLKDKDIHAVFKEIMMINSSKYNDEFLLGEIEEFFKKKMLWKAVEAGADVINNGTMADADGLVETMQEAMTFSFNTDVGLELGSSVERLFDSIHQEDKVIPTGIKVIDDWMEGFHEKSLTLFQASSGVGKTLMMCSFAVNALLQDKKILYVTFEDGEDKISRRILANMFDIDVNKLKGIEKQLFYTLHEKLIKNLQGKLCIKEFPEDSTNSNKIRALLKELKTKKNFDPDIVFVDYIGCMQPNRISSSGNSYDNLRTVAAELRAISMEFGMPFVSGLQTNRGGFGKLDMDVTDIADSIGIVMKADAIFGVVTSDELREQGRYKIIAMKNRFGEKGQFGFIKVNYPKMRISEDDTGLDDEAFDKPQPPELMNDHQNKPTKFKTKRDNGRPTVTFDDWD